MACKRNLGHGGFTLVELLVVVTIISILAALLVPAIRGAVATAKEAAIGVEISGMAQALENYKLKYGEYPPDFSGSDNEDKKQIRAHLSRTFRQWDSTEADNLSDLEPSEALYFWLRGFSPDPRYPLTGGGDRQPFFDFNQSRLLGIDVRSVRIDSDDWPEYVPAGGKNAPYIYFRFDSYQSNRSWTDPSKILGTARPYLASGRLTADGNSAYCAEKKFQIISAGLDGNYGPGNPGHDYPAGVNYVTGQDRGELDNMTSFSEGGTLGDRLD